MKLNKIALMVFCVILGFAFITSCASSGAAGRAPVANWSFGDPALGVQGWELANSEFYQYHGTVNLSYDNTTLGKGLLRMDLDFSKDKELEWSEPKMKNDFPRAFNMKGKTRFVFDFYYNPSYDTEGGHFKSKVFTNNNGILVDSSGDAIEGGEDAGEGFLKQTVSILIMPVSGFMTDLRFSIAGYLTAYKGPVFFDNMRFE
jgi:mannan endo-1,4-beta-mannosidase